MNNDKKKCCMFIGAQEENNPFELQSYYEQKRVSVCISCELKKEKKTKKRDSRLLLSPTMLSLLLTL